MKGTGGLIMLALFLASCRQQAEPPRHEEAAAPRKAGCADKLEYALNRPSFASNGADRLFPEARLSTFKTKAAEAFRDAANELCRTGAIKPNALGGLQRVVIETASGAMEPIVFQDQQFGEDTLVFQWVFAEADLAIPDRKAIAAGLRCWNDPDRAECAGDND